MDYYLNNSKRIECILKEHPSVFEPLYWAMEDALYNNNIDRAKNIYVDFLYLAKYRKQDLMKLLRPAYVDRLKSLAFELFEGTSLKARKSIELKSCRQSRSIPFTKEAQIRDYLTANDEILSDAFGEHISVMDTEVLTYDGYKCDILAASNRCYYPIELKIRQANHAVVSQIQKYCFYFYRRFRYGFYKPIQGVVCANGFDVWSINELRREGMRCFTMIGDGESIKLVEEH
jgi:hypothetical protein